MGFPEEAGRTVRTALQSWRGTVRLCLLLLFGSAAGAVCLTLVRWLGHVTA